MLRIIDARTGEPADAAPARRGLTRVQVHAAGSGLTDLRVLVVADLLVRALEIDGTPVWASSGEGQPRPELRAGAAALGVRPFEDGPATGLGGTRVVHVTPEGGEAPDGPRVAVAPASGPAPADLPDPAALRLALISRHHRTAARLDPAALDEAGATLARWRAAVARWARSPSRPVPEDVRRRLRGAWEDDLGVPEALAELRRVETGPDVPDGARFETYAYADRLLGLDLTAGLGSAS
ncbi:hypothetical protein ACFY3O_33645 [Streptomyces sp. NPDC001046]|uniref:hypothetical protein n=1 Tax=Streptomyces sp. NPDC001046 TaxID=3364543 RepID=UPI00369BF239